MLVFSGVDEAASLLELTVYFDEVCVVVKCFALQNTIRQITEFIHRLILFQLSECLRIESSYVIPLEGFLKKSVKYNIIFKE